MTNEKILADKELSTLNKVYNIARNCKEQGRLDPLLWYAILELKDEHIHEIIVLHSDVQDGCI